MSTEASTPDYGTPGIASATPSAPRRSAEPPSGPLGGKSSKPQRVLACVLCQQRKVKCDRRFPCVNCTKAKVTCVPATLGTRKRRPRFPERHLLDRIRHYEDLLRQNDVDFEPLHKDPKADRYRIPSVAGAGADDDSDGDHSGPLAADKPSPSSAAARPEWPYKDFWHAMRRGYRAEESDDSDEDDLAVHENTIKSAWDRMAAQMGETNDHLFFGVRTTSVDLSTLHPGPVQIFKLWQVYLDHVNPLLKATHTPSLQARIVTAVSDLGRIDPNLEALMFGIYCVAILSMVNSSCVDTFGESKNDLLTRYQFGCQQALLNASFLRTTDNDCLAALVFYLISVRSKTDPASLSSLLSVALRIAQRIGIAFEAGKEESPVLDAEMHRRLWWTLVLFDARVGELTRDSKTSPLALSWDAHIPLNVSESDLQPGSKEVPTPTSACSDALFVVVRAELANFMRHVDFYRMVINPSIELGAVDMRPTTESSLGRPKTVAALEQAIEDKYLRFCDPQIPLHYMTMWTTRSTLAKYRIVEMYTGVAGQVTPDTFTFWAIRWLECDTKLLTSPLTSGFGWMVNMYFPFPAYIQVLHDLKRRPLSKQAARGWEAISANFASHIASGDDYPSMFVAVGGRENPFFEVLLNMVVVSWEPREAALSQDGADVEIPWVVGHLRRLAAEARQDKSKAAAAGAPPPPSLDENFMNAMDIGASSDVGSGSFPMPPMPPDHFGGMGGASMMPPDPYPSAPDMTGYQPFGPNMDMSAMGMLDMDDTSWMKYFMN